MLSRTLLPRLASAVPLLVLAVVYLPDLGHGFIKDDFVWISGSRFDGLSGFFDLFRRHNGFYRPLVSLSFAFNEFLFQLSPFLYGLSNFVLVLIIASAIVLLARSLAMPSGTGVLAASLRVLNFHGVGGAILWISGRTSLLLTSCALLAAIAFVRSKIVLASLGCLLALLSKEEAVLLPVILAAWSGFLPAESVSWDPRRALRRSWPLLVPLGIYLGLRSQTGAYSPATAPTFYRPTLDWLHLARNIAEYTDRGCTVSAAALLLAMIILGRTPRMEPSERRSVYLGMIWLAGGYGLTVFLPVRSSIYAIFPSVGAALAAAVAIGSAWRRATEGRRQALLCAAVIVPLLLIPVYRSRNVRLVRTAEFSSQVLADVEQAVPDLRAGKTLVLHDAIGAKTTLSNAFGTLIQEAVRLTSGVSSAHVWVDPPPADWESSGLTLPQGKTVHYWVRDGRLVTVPSR